MIAGKELERLKRMAKRVLEKGYDCDCCYLSDQDQATRLVLGYDGVTNCLM